MEILGLVLGLAILIVLVFKKVPAVISVIVAALVAGAFNAMEPWTALNTLAKGTGNTFSAYFFVFFLATLYGELMYATGCANAISDALVKVFGKKQVILIIVLTTGLLVYGGVTAMVVCFTVFPIGVSLLKEANISKKFLPGLIAFGQATFALTALPGTPQLNNIIPTEAFGTTSTAAPLLGVIAAVVMFVLGILYFSFVIKKSKAKGEGFEEADNVENEEKLDLKSKPNWILGFLPLLILVGSYIALENINFWGYRFKDHGTYSAVSTAMFIAIIYLIILGFTKTCHKENLIKTLKSGCVSWVMPLLNFSMIVGFGSVIQATKGFEQLVQVALNIPGPAYVSAAVSVCLLAGVTGSASGGMKIALGSEALVENWLASGADPSALHRIASVSSGGLDSLPHCGGILATLEVCKETHSRSYIHIFVTTVIIPIIATAIIVLLASLGVVI